MVMNKTGNKSDDPQEIYHGVVKECRNAQDREIGVFTIPLGNNFEIVCLVNLPCDNETEFKVYGKYRIARRGTTARGTATVDRSSDKREARESDWNDAEHSVLAHGAE